MTLHEHAQHPHLAHRSESGAPTVGGAVAAHPSFNLRLAARGTKVFGSMPAFYAFVVYGALGAIFTAWQAPLLYWSNWAQLWSLPLLAVGSAVLSTGMNTMMQRQFDDVEALLHGQQQAAAHMAAQDVLLQQIAAHVGLNIDTPAAAAQGTRE